MSLRVSVLVGISVLAVAIVAAQTTPKAGSKERKAIMDGMRPTIEKALGGQKVIFKVKHLKVKGGWAFIYGQPIQPNGKPIDYRKTPYREAFESDAFDDNFCGLLKQKGSKWIVKDWRVGMTDVGWDGWWETYGAPRSIFPSYGTAE